MNIRKTLQHIPRPHRAGRLRVRQWRLRAGKHPIPPSLPEAMLFRRQQMGWTQKEASTHANMPLSRWQVIEAGATPSFTDARKLHNAGIPATVILQ